MLKELQRGFAGLIRNRNRPGTATPRPRRAMLRLEALEHRYAPAAWTVNTLNDTPVANVNAHNAQDADGHVSLRSAIQQANFDGGSTSISFSVTGTISEANAMDSLNSDITIMGPGASSLTVARSSTASTDFSDIRVNANKTCLIFGLTFNSGTGSGGKGGGVYNDGDLDLVSCSVTNNSANLGGASTMVRTVRWAWKAATSRQTPPLPEPCSTVTAVAFTT